MGISKEQIEQRRDILQNDINTARQRIADYDKKKQEDVALLNVTLSAVVIAPVEALIKST